MSSDDPGADAGGEETGARGSREQGVDIGALAEALEEHSYPTTTEELLAEYGDYEVEMASGSRELDDILGGQQIETESYESAGEVRQMIYNMVGDGAVGRTEYSDRSDVPGEGDVREDESF